jgi:hypothetical protein
LNKLKSQRKRIFLKNWYHQRNLGKNDKRELKKINKRQFVLSMDEYPTGLLINGMMTNSDLIK